MLEIQNLSKRYVNHTETKQVFDNFNLNIEEGEFVTVIGSNGAGKSTLGRLLNGDETPDQGVILLDGKDISAMSGYKKKRFITTLYQNPALGTANHMTVLENLAMAHNRNKPYNLLPSINRKNINYYKTLLADYELGLENQLYTKASHLSGGQRQVLAMIMATLHHPKLLLLDEHTSALDPKTSELVMKMTDDLVKQHHITTIMITHNMEHAHNYGSRLIELKGGQILKDSLRSNVDHLIQLCN